MSSSSVTSNERELHDLYGRASPCFRQNKGPAAHPRAGVGIDINSAREKRTDACGAQRLTNAVLESYKDVSGGNGARSP